MPTDVNTLASTLSSQFQIVLANQFFELLRRSLQGK
jgi:hypothetical protein